MTTEKTEIADTWSDDDLVLRAMRAKIGRYRRGVAELNAALTTPEGAVVAAENAKLRAELAEEIRLREKDSEQHVRSYCALRDDRDAERARADSIVAAAMEAIGIAGCNESELPGLLAKLKAEIDRLTAERLVQDERRPSGWGCCD